MLAKSAGPHISTPKRSAVSRLEVHAPLTCAPAAAAARGARCMAASSAAAADASSMCRGELIEFESDGWLLNCHDGPAGLLVRVKARALIQKFDEVALTAIS